MKLPLTIACGPYDRTRALFDGDVQIEGCDGNFLALSPEEIFYRSFGTSEFDVAELSFSTYLIQTARHQCDYIGIPAFLSRAFRHSAIYVRTDRVNTPADLKGARVGVPEYQVTAAVWARGMLQDEYGIAPSDINWVCGGVEELGRQEKTPIELNSDVRIEMASKKPLSQMLRDGDLDAILAPRAPSCFQQGKPNIGRLFRDYRGAEADYFRKTSLFPIMHLVGIKKALVADNPWLPGSVMKAFSKARTACLPALDDATALHITLPWLLAEAEWTRDVMGADPWPYGIEPNRKSIDALLRYHFDQGLSRRLLGIDEIFAAGAQTAFRV